MDVLRLAVTRAEPVEDHQVPDDFEVQIYVNGREMTATGAGMGMDPYDILIPDNRLLVRSEPHTTPVARCGCGTYGCGSTDVTITREASVVHWDWLIEVPMDRRATFSAAAYDREVARAGADTSWETPERTAGRLILTSIDNTLLARIGLRVGWLQTNCNDRSQYRIALQNETHQVFVDIPWRGRNAKDLAAEAVSIVAGPTKDWPASWHSMRAGGGPPAMASPSWAREHS